MEYFFVDSILAFRKKQFDVSQLNLFQFLRQRTGINSAMSHLLCQYMGYSSYIKIKDVDSDYVTDKLRFFFIRNRDSLDKLIHEYVNKNVNTLIKIKSYKGLRHYYKYPTRGQRTRSNARTSRKRKIL